MLSLATLLAYGGRWSWACELLVNFRTHYAALLSLALLVAVVARHWRIAGAAALALGLNLWPMYGAFFAPAATASGDGRALRVVALNVQVGNRDLPGIAAYLESLNADVVVLEEVTTATAERLGALLPGFAHRHVAVEEGVRGVAIFSRWPLLSPRRLVHAGEMFGVRVDLDLGDRQLGLYGMHFNWPLVVRAARGRNAQLQAIGRELAECSDACVVVGDFNTTPWSSHFRDLLAHSGFHDCAAGHGWLPTWPAGLPAWLRIRIDQCLVSPAVSVAGVRVGASVGSDHLSTINDLRVGRPSQ
jgi:endonuclease/exonuclease/phosphatase (EEP) superfamily protein YafD